MGVREGREGRKGGKGGKRRRGKERYVGYREEGEKEGGRKG